MERNSQLANYSLPGVMLYLQSEWSRNQRDRIQWESERSEMQNVISKLTSENTQLKKKLESLEQNSQRNGSSVVEKATENVSKNEVEVLVKAREYLNKRMDEVMYILRSQDEDENTQENVLLGLKQGQLLGVGRKRPVSDVPDLKLQEEQLAKDIEDVLKITPKNNDYTADIETDSETINADDDSNDENDQAENNENETTYQKVPDLKFSIGSHLQPVNQIEFRGNNVLTASTDGVINLWDLSSYLTSPSTATLLKSFNNEGALKGLKWVDDNLFITLGIDSKLKVWSVGASKQKYVLAHQFTDVKNFDVSDLRKGTVIVNEASSVKVVYLNLKKIGHSTPDIKDTEIKADYVLTEDQTTADFLIDGVIQKFDLSTLKAGNVSVLTGLDIKDKEIIKVSKSEDYYGFITSDKFFLYSTTRSKSVVFEKLATLTNFTYRNGELFLFHPNGDIEVYSSSATSEKFTLRLKFNHYGYQFGVDWDKVSNEERNVLKDTKNYGEVSSDGKVVLSCGQGADILGFDVSGIKF